jgi:hypothetical protein
MHTGRLTRAPGGSVLVQKIVTSKHLRCRPTPAFILANLNARKRKARRRVSELTVVGWRKLRAGLRKLSGSQLKMFPERSLLGNAPAATCAYATSNPTLEVTCDLRGPVNSARGSGARSIRRRVPWSIRACHNRALTVPQQEGRSAAPIFHGSASEAGLPISRGGADPRPRATGAATPSAAPIECTRPVSGQPQRWIPLAAAVQSQRTGGPPIFLRHAAYIPGVSAFLFPRHRHGQLRSPSHSPGENGCGPKSEGIALRPRHPR